MKKFILITILVLLAVGGVAVLAAGYWANQRVGYVESPVVTNAEIAPADTRFRIVVHPEKLADYADRFMPAGVELPAWLPWDEKEAAAKVMPRELALLGGTNYEKREIEMTVFVNERRGGPMLPDQLAHAGILESWSKVKWSKGFTLVRRGVLTAAGAIPMPSGLDTRLESRWDVKAGAGDPLQVEGGHLVEVVLDNRNGEAEALLGTLMNSPQLSWQVRFEDPNMKLLLEVLHDVHDVRLYADLASVDALRIKLRINVDEANAANFNIIPMMLPAIKDTLKQEYGLTLEGDADWDAKEEAYVGDFRISGLDAMVRSKLNPAGPAPAG